MEVKILPVIALLIVSVGILIGVGLTVLDKFGQASYAISSWNESFTVSMDSENSLAYQNLTQVLGVINSSTGTAVPGTNFTVNLTHGTFILLCNDTILGDLDAVDISYKYRDYESQTKRAMANVVTSVGDIPTTWLALIVMIIMLSIIMGFVLNIFSSRGGR